MAAVRPGSAAWPRPFAELRWAALILQVQSKTQHATITTKQNNTKRDDVQCNTLMVAIVESTLMARLCLVLVEPELGECRAEAKVARRGG